jgi:ribosome-associated protein
LCCKGRCTISNVAESSTATEHSPSLNFALAAAELAHNTRCEDIVLLDLRGRSPVTEFFVLATGSSPRQMRTVVEEIRDLGKKLHFTAWQTSGLETGRWILVDCVTVVCHVFDAEARDFYDLELLWGDSPRIDWRKELGLPPAPEGEREASSAQRFRQAAGADEMDAEEEDARLSGEDLDEEEGDADVDEDAESDAPVVVELPDESTGSNSVEFVEIDPPGKRRKRGRAVYPTPIGDEDAMEDEQNMRVVSSRGGAEQSLDEDEQERESELAADTDVEATSDEDLPERRVSTRPMGGVSASLSSTSIENPGEEDQEESHGAIEDAEQDHRDEIPEAHEEAAETTTLRKGTVYGDGVDLSTERASERSRKRVLKNRASMGKPTKSAPGRVNVKKAKAGVVKTKKAAPKKTAAKKPAVKKKPVAKKKAVAKKKPAAKKKK